MHRILGLIVLIVLLYIIWKYHADITGYISGFSQGFCGSRCDKDTPFAIPLYPSTVTNPFIYPHSVALCNNKYPIFTHAAVPDHPATTE